MSDHANPEPVARSRSLRRSLGSIVLGFETIVVFLAALMLFGLKNLPPLVALGGGGLMVVALVVTIRLLKFSWGYTIGWALQILLIVAGFANAVLFIVGGVFGGLWAYSMWKGTHVDRINRQRERGNVQ